jgi:hypothetical protein
MENSQTQILRHGSATIIIHRPVINETERAKREQQVRNVLGSVMRDYFKRKETPTCPTTK